METFTDYQCVLEKMALEWWAATPDKSVQRVKYCKDSGLRRKGSHY